MVDTTSPEAEPILPCGLTAAQKRKWEDTMSMMAWKAPGFRHLFMRLLNAQSTTSSEHTCLATKAVPIAATDGKVIMVNPDTFFEEGLPERVFIIGHEVVHNVFGDVEAIHRWRTAGVPTNNGKRLPYDDDTMQRAMDARINALLVSSRIGKPPKCGGIFDKDVKDSDSVIDVYQRYYEEKFGDDPDGQEPSNKPGNNPGGFDTIMRPGAGTGQNPSSAAGQRNNQQWAVEIAAAQTIEAARSQGKMAAGLQRMFQQVLEPEVPWVDHIETVINKAVGDGSIDWTQPNAWLGSTPEGDDFFWPADTGFGAGWIVIWGDTSGSRDDSELTSNVSELHGIMGAVNPRRISMIWGDAEVGQINELTDPADLASIKAPPGGGGTDYQPVLDWIAAQDEKPDLFIGFTDGFVDHPDHHLPFPVIWASSTDQPYPFGQVVKVNRRKRA